jgi:hypothetical protein
LSAARRLTALVGALLLFRLGSALVVFQPGYTDAYYYADVAKRLAAGQGLTADFIWNFIEGSSIPLASHRFWMPLATVVQAIGIKTLPFLDAFHAAQTVEILIACAIPVVAYLAARSFGASVNTALVAGALAGLGGIFAPGWVSLDAFAPAAVIGTVFFLLYRRAAAGDVRAGAFAGLAVGLLFLARAEGALFGLALLGLLRAPVSRHAGLAASTIALAIGLGWLARDLTLGSSPDLFAGSALLVRYEDFFAVPVHAGTIAAQPVSSLSRFVAALPTVIDAKIAALGTNAVLFAFAFGLLLVPGVARAAWTRTSRPDVRAFAGLLVLIYIVESLVFTLHSTRGSYFHSLAAFIPYGVALGVVGMGDLLRTVERQRVATVGGLTAAVLISVFALTQWDASFNPTYRVRLAVVGLIPPGTFMVIDAAAWRWIADRPAVVTPASGPDSCTLGSRDLTVTSLVLEPAHFSAYDPLYHGSPHVDFIEDPDVAGGVQIFRVNADRALTICQSIR